MVRAALEREGFGEVLAEGITRLCTLHRELPPGAPTSPALLSAVLRPLDDALAAETARHGLTYTRYMDDLFVSGGRRVGTLEAFLRAQVRNAGYKIAENKIKTWSPGSRATLAGIVLGTVPSPTAEFVESVTTLLRKVELGELRDPKSLASLRGKVGWIRALWPQKGKALSARLMAACA